MMIAYTAKGKQDLDSIALLWDKLREHQRVLSLHFPQHYASRTWKRRKAELLQRAREGGFHLDIVTDSKTKKIIGYCVSTISSDKQGQLESIYIEPEYRKAGIGDRLMQKALQWMEKNQTKTKTLIVGVGNEEVLSFYSRYGFFPKHITAEQVETEET
jgi:ribosomal protein S18 acetylase RimI-like enzyme